MTLQCKLMVIPPTIMKNKFLVASDAPRALERTAKQPSLNLPIT